MGYISKYNSKFIAIMQRKYKDYNVSFSFIDDYLLWLYETYCKHRTREYYKQLEQDIIYYSNFQTGSEREKRGRLNDSWWFD